MKTSQPIIKIEENYTQIENELYNWSIHTNRLGKPQKKIFDLIVRQTNGFHRLEAPMSFRFIEKKTGINHRNVGKELEDMIYKDIIKRHSGPKMKYGKPVYIYRINKKYCRRPDDSTDIYGITEADVPEMSIKETNILKKSKKELANNMTFN